jgi:histidinol-phosphate aminotransferase
MRRFLDYYRQFEELPPEEVSRRLRERRDEEKARAVAELPALDLASAAWHEPPHPEIVNAATFALRRAVNGYPDPDARALRELLAARHGVDAAQVVVGHGAGELIRAALGHLLGGRADSAGAPPEVLVAWPGWATLPRLADEAGGMPVPVPLAGAGAPDATAMAAAVGERTRVAVLCSPNDPTGAEVDADGLRRLAATGVWIVLDAALADFGEADLAPLARELERLIVVRSFSKAFGMAGFRAGYAIGPPPTVAPLAPVAGASAPAQAGMAWAAEHEERVLPRRRALAAAERERLAAAIAGTPLAFPPGTGPLVWLSAAGISGAELAEHLAARRIFVTPGSAWGDERHVRAALRGPEATERLAAALAEIGAP